MNLPTITREELKAKLERGDPVILVDALPEAAYRKHHLPRAINIPSERIQELAPKMLPDRHALIVVYCGNAACKRSDRAVERLIRLGYSNVRDYHEGRQDWAKAGLALETGTPPELRLRDSRWSSS